MNSDYEKQIRKYLKQFPEVTQDASPTRPLYSLLKALSDKWAKEFAKRAESVASRMISQVDFFSKKNLGNSLKEMSGGLSIKTPMLPQSLSSRITASTMENVALIKSIPAQYHERIANMMMRSIQTGGQGAKQIFDFIQHTGTVTKHRAELIAVDQTRKITTACNTERMKSVGVKQFEWIHSGGGAEPRELHVEYDGQIFDFDNPPVIDNRTGERGFPGQLINCRCKMRPVVDFTQYIKNE